VLEDVLRDAGTGGAVDSADQDVGVRHLERDEVVVTLRFALWSGTER
jgi:hypothetical protein